MNKEEKHKLMTRTDREAQAQHNDTKESMAFFILQKQKIVYTRFNRFKHCAINKDEKLN